MVHAQLGPVLRHIQRLAHSSGLDGLGDGELLERFAVRGEEAAFAMLVRRHGPMVLGVCRRVLRHGSDAEDAFQATFLVLFRRARALNRAGSLANYLYTVAYHVALKARADAARRQRCEKEVRDMPRARVHVEELWSDLQPVLDEELNRLPDHYRAAVVVCYLQGKTNEEAARLLGCAAGTIKSRLARARNLLRQRLARRGVALSAGLLGAVLMEHAAAAVSPTLVRAAVQTTVRAAAGQALAPAASLADSVLKAMFVTKLKIATALLLGLGTLVFAAVVWTHQARARDSAEEPAGAAPPVVARGQAGPETKEPAQLEGPTISVRGRVLDADGKPVAAAVAVLGSPRRPSREETERDGLRLLGQGTADAEGRFRLTLPRTSSLLYYSTQVVASAAGHGLSCDEFDPAAERPEVTLRLRREQVLRCRVVDLQGAPAAKVELRVESVSREKGKHTSAPSRGVPAWPAPVTTDAQGRFVLRGFGPDHGITLEVHDARFARQRLDVPTDPKDRAGEITLPLPPPQVLTGRITRADTGKPAAGARLVIDAGQTFRARADAEGRFEVPVSDAKFVYVYAAPPDGEPYLTVKKSEAWPKGAVRHAIDLALPRGVVVTGKVTEAPSGKPVAGADVQYFPQLTDNPDRREDVASLSRAAVESGPGGEFRIVLPPGPAHLLVTAATPDCVHQEVAFSVLAEGKPDSGSYRAGPEGNAYFGGQRVYAHAVVPVKLKRDTEPEPLKVTLRRGVTVRGRLQAADGKPVARTAMVSRLNVSPWDHVMSDVPVKVYDGRFELRGCDPKATYRVIFFDPAHEQGAVAEIAGKQADDAPVTVRLAPCGAAKARLLKGGQPLKDKRVKIDLIVTPGGSGFDGKEGLLADAAWLSNFDWPRYGGGPRTDGEGRLKLPALVPGATYRIHLGGGFKDVVVEAGKAVDWGDIDEATVFEE